MHERLLTAQSIFGDDLHLPRTVDNGNVFENVTARGDILLAAELSVDVDIERGWNGRLPVKTGQRVRDHRRPSCEVRGELYAAETQ